MGRDDNIHDSGTGKAQERQKSDSINLVSLARQGIENTLRKKRQ
jgi:hypothetical protein